MDEEIQDTDPSRLMWVRTVDHQGRDLGDGRWVVIPKPTIHPSHGLQHISDDISRLLHTHARFASLVISTHDGSRAISYSNERGSLTFSVGVNWRTEPDTEARIRSLFSDLGITPTKDYLAGNGLVPDATRILDYPLPTDSGMVQRIASSMFLEVYGLAPDLGLDTTFQEHTT